MAQIPRSRRTQIPQRVSRPRRGESPAPTPAAAPVTQLLAAHNPPRSTGQPLPKRNTKGKARRSTNAHRDDALESNRRSRGLAALLVAFLAFLLGAILERETIASAVAQFSAHQYDVSALTQDQMLAIAQIALLPLGVAVVAYLLAAAVILFVRLWLYTQGLSRYVTRTLRASAPLYRIGVAVAGARFNAKGEPDGAKERPLRQLIHETPHMLLVGEVGAGKTVSLLAGAAHWTRRWALFSLLLGAAPLPVLVPLASYAQALGEGDLTLSDFVVRQMRIFGSPGLVARLPRMLRGGRVVLLCDGLHDVPVSERPYVCSQLAELAHGERSRARVIVTFALDSYTHESRSIALLHDFTRVVLSGLSDEMVMRTLRQTRPPKDAQRPKQADLPATLGAHQIATSAAVPATLAALLTVWGDSAPLPHGRGQLYLRYADILSAQAAGTRLEPSRIRFVLGMLASSLRRADERVVAVMPGASMGVAVTQRLETLEPLAPLDLRTTNPQAQLADEVDAICRAALQAGILMRSSDSIGLSFASSVLEAAFAALWLRETDDGFGRLNPELLRPQWIVPLLLWAGSLDNSADLAERLRRLVDTPDSTSVRARLPAKEAVVPLTLVVSLATLAEGLSVRLAELATAPEHRRQALELGEQHLRDVLDLLQSYAVSPDTVERVADALAMVQEYGGTEVMNTLIELAKLSQLNRLARAQIIMLLGLRNAPLTQDALVELLPDSDPIIRQAVNQAYIYAGVQALPSLRAALTGQNERARIRAGEVLALLGDAAIDIAIAGLLGTDAGERATAARTLGALRADRAEKPLIERLDDPESAVRVAAAHALALFGTATSVSALQRHSTAQDAQTRAAVAQALGAARNPQSYATLVTLLNDPEGKVRAAAATALGLLGNDQAVPALQERRADPDPWAQNVVVSALRSLGY
ncbi:MAG: NACHT domain-containing protein [Ktedonobacterales bacterium]